MTTRTRALRNAIAAIALIPCLTVPAEAQTPPVPGVFTPQAYGARCDGKTDDTAAFQACARAASAAGGEIDVSGVSIIRGTVTATNCNVKFLSPAAELRYYPPAGSSAPLWTCAGASGRCMVYTGFRAEGQNGTSLGIATNPCPGLLVTGGPIMLRDCWLSRFYAALDIDNPSGHVYIDNCDLSGYYGIWWANNAGDYKIDNSRIGGTFAALGYGCYGLQLDCRRSALSFSPFAVYQVNTNTVQAASFFNSVFDHCAFEAIGNEVSYSEYARLKPLAHNLCNTTDLVMTGCGISFLSLYTLPAYPRDYAIEMDAPESEITLDFGIFAVPPGKLGQVYFARPAANASSIVLKWRGASASSVTAGTERKPMAITVQGGM